jgi:hypothetical protein
MPDDGYRPMMSEERARRLRKWHDDDYEKLRASLPLGISSVGLELHRRL